MKKLLFTILGLLLIPNGAFAVTYATFDPANKSAQITLSGGNLVATNNTGGSDRGVKSTLSVSSGKWYWEMTDTSNDAAGMMPGIANSTASLENYVGSSVNGFGWNNSNGSVYYNAGVVANFATYTTGDVIGIALDASNGHVTYYKNCVSQGTITSAVTGPYYAMVSAFTLNTVWTANFGASAFSCSVPSGYNAGLFTPPPGGAVTGLWFFNDF